jgi:soluble lytic murein transglycosylase
VFSVGRGALRWLLLGVVVVLGVVTLLFLRGPSFWQRQYYPLAYEAQIADSAARHRVNPYLVAAVINAESGWGADRVSGAGAIGLMQVMPETARDLAAAKRVDRKRFPPDKLHDPATNIEYGTAYIRYLVDRYHEIEMALAAYNAGLTRVDQWAKKGGNIRAAIEFPETKQYVLKVMRGKDRYETLHPDAFAK